MLVCGTKGAKQVTLQLCCMGYADGPSSGTTDCLVGVSKIVRNLTLLDGLNELMDHPLHVVDHLSVHL